MYSRYYQQHRKKMNTFIVTGKHLATTEKFPTREAAEEKINSVDWNLVAAMIYACKEADEYEKKLKRTAKKVSKGIVNDAKKKED